jgi:hypothetical protein
MKQLYFIILFCIATLGYSQDKPTTGDIEGFKLYPNPVTSGKIYIITSLNAPKKVLIFDVLGTKVMESTIIGTELNLSDIDAGMYVIRVYEKDKMVTRKLIVN